MKQASCSTIVLAMTLLLSGCAAGPDTVPATPAPTAVAADESGEADMSPAAASLRRALREAVDDRSSWDSLYLLVGCVGDAGMRTAEVYGNGVGIWDSERQFTLRPAEITALLEALHAADFASFADVYGGRKQPDPRVPEKPKEPEPQVPEERKGPDPPVSDQGRGSPSAIRVICRVVLSLGGQTKRVAQLGKGEQSAELKQLAEDLLAICAKPGQEGTAAADLTDGLEKVARGELAPETFRVLLNRKPEKTGEEAGGDGFLLRLAGTRVTSRGQDPVTGLLDPLGLTLSPAEVADLARELAGLDLARLPINLFAEDYTDLTVEVLDHKKSVQARQFAGMTPTTHGESQLVFERIYELLHRLHLRVVSAGEPAREAGGSG